VFATSLEDAEKFRLFYGAPAPKLGRCPNGYDDEELGPVVLARRQGARRPEGRPKLLFMGSAHRPNVEAARFLVTLAKDLPECDVLVAGGISDALALCDVPSNFFALGPFDAARKLDLLKEADVFLNPVVQGSGTSL